MRRIYASIITRHSRPSPDVRYLVHPNEPKTCTIDIKHLHGHSLLNRARDLAITDFINRPEYTHYAAIDDDLDVLPCTDVNVFDQLLSHGKDFVCAPVAGRAYPIKCMQIIDSTRKSQGKLAPVRWCGGFVLISKAAILALCVAYPDLWYHDDATGKKKIYGLHTGTWIQAGEQRKLLSEDWWLCERYNAVFGNNIWMDTSIVTRHWGEHGYMLIQGNGKEMWQVS
jgi:hypothetical protein